MDRYDSAVSQGVCGCAHRVQLQGAGPSGIPRWRTGVKIRSDVEISNRCRPRAPRWAVALRDVDQEMPSSSAIALAAPRGSAARETGRPITSTSAPLATAAAGVAARA